MRAKVRSSGDPLRAAFSSAARSASGACPLTPLVVIFVAYTFFSLDALGDEIEDRFGTDPSDPPLDTLSRDRDQLDTDPGRDRLAARAAAGGRRAALMLLLAAQHRSAPWAT